MSSMCLPFLSLKEKSAVFGTEAKHSSVGRVARGDVRERVLLRGAEFGPRAEADISHPLSVLLKQCRVTAWGLAQTEIYLQEHGT